MDSDIQNLIDVDRLIHEPARLVVVSMLYAVESTDFTFLLHQSGLTKGNLSAHLSRLEQAGYIEVSKGYRGRVPQTVYSLTPTGRCAFRKYRACLKRAVDSMPE